jgi:uncharacterized membrane protein
LFDAVIPQTYTSFFLRGCYLFALLLLYSFLGWCGEMVYCSLGQKKLCEKRGFLNGPICPIYGHGALLVLVVLKGGCESPVATFFLGAILTSAVEYFTSWAMEVLFHMRWWDYSRYKFNLNGRVCLLNSTLFGLASVLLCHVIHPALARSVQAVFARGVGVPVTVVLSIIYVADIVLSVRSAIQIRVRLEKLHAIYQELSEKLEQAKQEREEELEAQRAKLELAIEEQKTQREAVREERREKLEERSEEFTRRLEAISQEAQQKARALYEKQDFLERRLMRSYPGLRSKRHGEALKRLREYMENKSIRNRRERNV